MLATLLTLPVLMAVPSVASPPPSWQLNENSAAKPLYGDMIPVKQTIVFEGDFETNGCPPMYVDTNGCPNLECYVEKSRFKALPFLTPLQRLRYEAQKSPLRGVSRKENSVNRWSHNIVPYTLSSQYSEEQKKAIRRSLDSLQRISCFRFIPRSTEKDFLAFMPLDGCYSYVGKIGGTQVLSLSVDCVADYIIWHEVMHAIGLEHEHQRPDRDKYIRIEYRNVQEGQMMNFEKLSPYEVDFKDAYDYKSIMHYDSHAFGRRDPKTKLRLATMIPLKKGVTLEDNLKLSPSDVEKLNRLGNCNVTEHVGRTDAARRGFDGGKMCKDLVKNCSKLKQVVAMFQSVQERLHLACDGINGCGWIVLDVNLSSRYVRKMSKDMPALRYNKPFSELFTVAEPKGLVRTLQCGNVKIRFDDLLVAH